MDRACALAGKFRLGIRIDQGVLDEPRLGAQSASRFQAINAYGVLPLDRDEAILFAEVDMPGAKPQPVSAGRQGLQVGKLAIVEAQYVQRPGIFRLPRACVVAARDQHHAAARRGEARLVREDAQRQRPLRDFFADTAIAVDTVNADGGGNVVGRDQEAAARIDGDVHGALAQLHRHARRRQRAAPAHMERLHAVIVLACLVAAGRHIQKPETCRIGPGVLHIRRQHHAAHAPQLGAVFIQSIPEQLRPDAGVKGQGAARRMGRRHHGGAQQGSEQAAVEHRVPPFNGFQNDSHDGHPRANPRMGVEKSRFGAGFCEEPGTCPG